MKKLLALLLLSPLAFAEQSSVLIDGNNTLDLENLSQYFPNDSYVGLSCSNEKDEKRNSIEYYKKYGYFSVGYYMFVVSISENTGRHLMSSWFTDCFFCKGSNKPEVYKIIIDEKKYNKSFELHDSFIEFTHTRISRNTLRFLHDDNIQCEISSQEELKQFGYGIVKKIQDYEKVAKDRKEAYLKKRKL